MRWPAVAVLLAVTTSTAAVADAPRSDLDRATILVLGGMAVGVAAWDVYAITNNERTASRVLRDASWQVNTIPYVLGGLAGHLFFSTHKSQDRLVWWVASVPAVLAFDIAAHNSGNRWFRNPGMWFGLGVGIGSLTWGREF